MINKALALLVVLAQFSSAAAPARVNVRVAQAGSAANFMPGQSGSKVKVTVAPLGNAIPKLTVTGIPGVTVNAANTAAVGQNPNAQTALTGNGQTAQTGEAVTGLTAEVASIETADVDALAQIGSEGIYQAPAQTESLLSKLGKLVLGSIGINPAFDNAAKGSSAPGMIMGILPNKKQNLPEGVELDPAPESPAPQQVGGVNINAVGIPGARGVGGIFEAGPIVLQADPASEASVEAALRQLVDSDQTRYGVTSAELQTVHIKRVEGKGEQADTVFAYFQQVKDGVPIHNANLSFTVKVIKGRAVVLAAMAKLYPNTTTETTPRYTDEQLASRAWERIGMTPDNGEGIELSLIERKIIYSRGRWHSANLYLLRKDTLAVMLAVDVATGEAFAWDPRMGVAKNVQAVGRAPAKGPIKATSEIVDIPLAHLTVEIDGKKVTSDRDGWLNVEVAKETKVTATLKGLYAVVNNKSGKPLEVTVTLKPGEQGRIVFNTLDRIDEQTIAQVNGYWITNAVHDFLADNGVVDKRLDIQIPVNANIQSECNAYYTPRRPTLNTFNSSDNCVNSAYDTVLAHEYGHFVDDMLGGIVNGGLSEGWGDIFSMLMLRNPIVGEGFMKQPRGGVDYIRHGVNDYQYQEHDEVHDQGQAWGGFAWRLHLAMTAAAGEAGAAIVRAIILPTIFAKASDIPAAMAQVLVNDMDKNGNIPHEKEIRAAARHHGVTLPQNPGLVMRLVNWLANPGRWFAALGTPGSLVGDITVPSIDSKRTAKLSAAMMLAPYVDVVIALKQGTKAELEVVSYLSNHGLMPTSMASIGLVTATGLSAKNIAELEAMGSVLKIDSSGPIASL